MQYITVINLGVELVTYDFLICFVQIWVIVHVGPVCGIWMGYNAIHGSISGGHFEQLSKYTISSMHFGAVNANDWSV